MINVLDTMCITATKRHQVYKQLITIYQLLYEYGDQLKGREVYKLAKACLIDDKLTTEDIKIRLAKIARK